MVPIYTFSLSFLCQRPTDHEKTLKDHIKLNPFKEIALKYISKEVTELLKLKSPGRVLKTEVADLLVSDQSFSPTVADVVTIREVCETTLACANLVHRLDCQPLSCVLSTNKRVMTLLGALTSQKVLKAGVNNLDPDELQAMLQSTFHEKLKHVYRKASKPSPVTVDMTSMKVFIFN